MNNRINFQNEIMAGLQTAFLNQTVNSNLSYRPEFLSNDPTKGKKVLVSIEQELAACDEFRISVAFITKSGITPLLQILKDLETKGIPGKILTTDYLLFSEPEALEKLASLSNIELRMYTTNGDTIGFHTKGYIFRQKDIYRFIIGSSNITLNAVTRNKEWNTKFVSAQNGEMAQEILSEFNTLWQDEHTKTYGEFISDYRIKYKNKKIINIQGQLIEEDNRKYVPNKMQTEFINNVLKFRAQNIDKAMLLSPTGTGKH